MIKTYLTAAVLAAMVATPAVAQQMGGSTEGSSMGSDSSGALDTQETQIPATDATGQPSETQIPAGQPGAPDSQAPADQSGQPMDQQQPQGSMSQPSDTQEATVPSMGPQAGELSQSSVMEVQDALTQQGFNPGPTDGMMGPQTASALREFQQSKGIEATGQADQQTLAALGITEGGQSQPQQQQQQPQQQEQAPSQP